MNKILLMLVVWLALPLIIEFDYRVFNKLTNQNFRRKDYLATSVAELVAFDIGVFAGWFV